MTEDYETSLGARNSDVCPTVILQKPNIPACVGTNSANNDHKFFSALNYLYLGSANSAPFAEIVYRGQNVVV